MLVSVIIPIYDVVEFLDRCVRSLLNQTYNDLEVILVDDGSTDGSADKCDEFARLDPRVRVVHKPNGGLADARNSGLNIANGEYIVFVDGDDFVGTSHVADLLHAIRETGASMVVSRLHPVKATFVEPPEAMQRHDIRRLDHEEALERLFYQRISNSACGKLYRSSLFADLRYPSGALYEDLALTYRVIASAGIVAESTISNYYYVQRQGSIMRIRDVRRRAAAIDFAGEAVDFVKAQYPHLVRAARCRLFIEAATTAASAASLREIRRDAPEVRDILKRERLQVITNSNASLTMRIYAISSLFGLHGVRFAGHCRAIGVLLFAILQRSTLR